MALKPKNKEKQHHNQQASTIGKSKSTLDLPWQLINIIERHQNLEKKINFGGTVKSWRTPPKHCIDKHSKLPWLQLSDPDSSNTQKHSTHSNHSFACYYYYTSFGYWGRPELRLLRRHALRTVPRYPWKHYVGCSNGILIAEAEPLHMYYLWNPSSREILRLPLWDAKVPIKLAVLSSSPEDPNCTVMVLTGVIRPAFAFYKLKTKRGRSRSFIIPETQWTMQDCTFTEEQQQQPQQRVMQFTNAIGFKGKFYALSVQGNLAVIQDIDSVPMITDLSAARIVPSVPSDHFREYMLESDGEVLLVFLVSRRKSWVHNVDDVEVYQLNLGRLSWFKLESIGERAFFVGSNCSVSVLASEVGCRQNCIYFRHPMADEWWVYAMESGKISPGWSEGNLTTSAIRIEQI